MITSITKDATKSQGTNRTNRSKLFCLAIDVVRLKEDGGARNLGGAINEAIANP